MYSLKPIVALPERIDLPDTVYALPRIQGGGASCSSGSGSIAVDSGCQVPNADQNNMLEFRQMKILKQLCELKEQVEYLCVTARLADVNKPQGDAGTAVRLDQKPVHAEMIVYANPGSPPYSILALQRIWKDTEFKVETHRHSSVPNAETKSFEEKLLAGANSGALHRIDLKLIWKDVHDVQFITKVYDYPFEGEANVLRYLTRIIGSCTYEGTRSLAESMLTDTILDLCLQLSYEEPRNVNAITARFTSHLGKAPWLLNAINPTIVDVATWSVVKRVVPNRVPKELKNWYDLCEKTFLST